MKFRSNGDLFVDTTCVGDGDENDNGDGEGEGVEVTVLTNFHNMCPPMTFHFLLPLHLFVTFLQT